ncbi:MAG: acyltransferase [Spirochaetes bacterium]|nr:acyltransferase [Spirochaetota bacterium]
MTRALTDFAKVIAAIAVVGIHATSTAENNFAVHHNFFSLDFGGVLLNQWARFSVPLFLYLSAYGLAQSKELNFFSFMRKRLPTILIPYFFFSALAFALDFKNCTTENIIERLLKGGADYHLYFLVILAQCYLLFPLLLRLHQASGKVYRAVTLVVFLLVVLLLYRTSSERILGYFGLSHPGWHASFCIYWLPYFMLGIMHGKASPAAWGRFTAFVAVVLALGMVLADYILASRQGIPVDYYNHFSRPAVALYALAVVYSLWAIRLPTDVERGLGVGLAPLTFAVYLIHPQILRVFNAYLASWPSLAVWAATVVVSFGLVYVVKKSLEKIESPPVHFIQRALGLR